MGWRAVTQGLSQVRGSGDGLGKGPERYAGWCLPVSRRRVSGLCEDRQVDSRADRLNPDGPCGAAIPQSVLGPIANALSSAFAGPDIGGSVTAAVSHTGGMVGISGYTRSVPAMAFAGAPRMHAGGMAGLRPDEVPTILQRGERVLNRRETAQYSAGGAGMSRVRIELGEGLMGSIMEQAGAQSVEIVQGSLQHYDRLIAPRTVARVSQDPRRSG